MNNHKPYLRILDLKQKIVQLLEGYQEQQKLIQQLQNENRQLIQEVNSQKTAMHSAATNLEIDNTAAHPRHQPRDWEARLDSYISAIDRSIAYLEQLQ